MLPCLLREEIVLVDHGTLVTSPMLGTRPGAGVVLATRHGMIRYADAELTLNVNTKRTEVTLARGNASATAAGAKSDAGADAAAEAQPIPSRKPWTLTGSPDPEALLTQCETTTRDTIARAQAVLDGGAGKGLGERAAAHVRARKRARGECAVAAAATISAEVKTGKAASLTRALTLNRAWRKGKMPPESGQ